jgi:hypothetical protein
MMRKETAPTSATMPVQRLKTRLCSVSTPAISRKAAKPIAETRNGPVAAVVTALLTTGFALAPSELAAAIVTNAIVIPMTPVSAPANATRASCTELRTSDSARSSMLRIAAMKYRNAKAASSIAKAPMRPFHWLSCAQFVHA